MREMQLTIRDELMPAVQQATDSMVALALVMREYQEQHGPE